MQVNHFSKSDVFLGLHTKKDEGRIKEIPV